MKNKTTLLFPTMSLLAIPLALAEDCGLTNLAQCIPQKLFEYFLSLINTPFQPFLALIKNLLYEAVNISVFQPLWAIIVYIISIFYGLFLLLVGFNFIISGYSAEKREHAKEMLKNIVLMVVFVQASYFLYSLLIDLSAQLTASVFNMIDPNFFLLTADSLSSFALELVFSIVYLMSLLLCIIVLAIRYIIVAIGVISFPIGIFFNFIPPLRGYGRLMIDTLIIMIFIPFFESLVLLGASKLINIPIFQNYKILIMTCAFLIISLSMIVMALFVMAKSAFSLLDSPLGRAGTMVAKGGL